MSITYQVDQDFVEGVTQVPNSCADTDRFILGRLTVVEPQGKTELVNQR